MKIYLKRVLFIFTFIIIICTTFIYGTIYNPRDFYKEFRAITKNKLLCSGISNLVETYHLECFSPLPKSSFKFDTHLECSNLIQNSYSNYLENNEYVSNNISLSKVDHQTFTLNIQNNQISISKYLGNVFTPAPYRIISNESDIIQAISKKTEDTTNKSVYPTNNPRHLIAEYPYYGYLTFSKSTGRGMMSKHIIWDDKQNSIGVDYFQCK